MKKITVFFVSSLMVLLMSFGFAIAKEEYVMKFSWVDPVDPMGHSTSAYAAVLKAEVEKLSGGRIKVELYPAGQLGDQRSSVQQVRKGTIELCNISSGVLASLYYEKLGIFDMPFSFSSREVARRVFDYNNPFTRKIVEDCAKKTGIRIISLQPFGFRNLTNNIKPIKSPNDMKGLKIRTMEIVPHMKLMESLGSSPVPIPFLELYTSLQTKVVDGQENTLSNIIAKKFYQVQKHLTLSGHLMGVGASIMNEAWFQSLPDDLKLAVIEGEKVAQIVYTGMGELLDTLALEKLKSFGMVVYAPSPKEMKMFKDQAIPYVRKWMEGKIGSDFVTEYLAALESAENELMKEKESMK